MEKSTLTPELEKEIDGIAEDLGIEKSAAQIKNIRAVIKLARLVEGLKLQRLSSKLLFNTIVRFL